MGFAPIVTEIIVGLFCADKPQIEELRYFLEFQVPRIWAPVHDRFPGQPRKEPVCPSLQFSMMGQKLYVSQEQVSVYPFHDCKAIFNVTYCYHLIVCILFHSMME